MSAVLRTDRSAPGELFIWTDIAPEFEADFNQWYDREHMAERAAIAGFDWSRRYVQRGQGRKYLAVYRTQSLDVFTSAAYRKAFEHQTDWSIANFGRMRNTQRRVMAVSVLGGQGTGGVLLLARLTAGQAGQPLLAHAQRWLEQIDGLLTLRVLTPDPELSTPLPSEDMNHRTLDAYLLADLTTAQGAHALTTRLQQDCGLEAADVNEFSLLWDLRSTDLNAGRAQGGH
ncbi:MAG TPA: hypothetical protein PLG97_02125 [Alcaligenes sp.]|nr:hypothetical protein [Alcaligenes sp.]HRL26292.1 hypothetical protein [Alcaligenes sp.]